MKTVYACALVMVITLLGGCAEQTSGDKIVEGWWRDVRIEPGPPGCPPTTIVTIHVPDSVHPTLLAVKRTLKEIDLKMKDVKKNLDVANKKIPTSGDSHIERAIKEIDSKIMEVRTALDITSRRIQISGDVVQIITYLRPKLNVELDPNVLCADNITKMTFNITNLGEHSVSIGEPQLTLSTEYIWGKDAISGILSSDVDYKLQWESDGFYVAPGQTIQRVAYIEIRQAKLEGRPLFYNLCIDAETEPAIVDVLSGLLLDSLETEKLYSISRASFKFAGEIETSTSHDSE